MTVTTAATNGVVSTDPIALVIPLTTATVVVARPPPATSAGTTRTPNTAATNEARMFASSSEPAVGHHRPFTRSYDRVSARNPPVCSIRSTGIATDHAAYSHTPGMMHAANATSSSTPCSTSSHSRDQKREKPKRSDPRQSDSVPRYVSPTVLKHAACASVADTTPTTKSTSTPATTVAASPPFTCVVVLPLNDVVVVVVPVGSDNRTSTLRT